MQNIAAVLQ
jgi:enamine deaminase RidA (YjgF/YER057c/UK114 family)